MFANFKFRGLNHLELYCTLTNEARIKISMHFDSNYMELWNACIFRLAYILLNVRDEMESKYPWSELFFWVYHPKSLILLIVHKRYVVGTHLKCLIKALPINTTRNDMGLVVRKPVYVVSDKARLKPILSATETS